MTSSPKPISEIVADVLSASGYGFQHAVYRKLSRLFESQNSIWRFEASELPYQVRNRDGRVDLVLKHLHSPIHLCVEFKRTDPQYNRWVFARGSISRFGRTDEYAIVDGITSVPRLGKVHVHGYELDSLSEAYTVAVIAPGPKHSGDWKPGRRDFEETATQACAGAAGLLEHMVCNRMVLPAEETNFVIPMIVTTAELFVAKKSLLAADPMTGDVVFGEGDIENKKHLFFQYPTSPGIRPGGDDLGSSASSFGRLLDAKYLRTLPVTTVDGLETCLNYLAGFRFAVRQPAGSY